MLLVNRVRNLPYQKQTIIIEDGTSFDITMSFRPMQYGWFITEFVYGEFTVSNLRVTVNANMLHQFRNKLPFGLACFPSGADVIGEPMNLNDFSTERFQLFVLTQDEVNQYAEYLTSE